MPTLDTLKREIKFLPLSRKLVLVSSLFSILFLFIPWVTYGVIKGKGIVIEPKSYSAFSMFPVFGWLLLGIALISLVCVFQEMLFQGKGIKSLSYSTLWLLLGGAGIYTVSIALFVFNSSYIKDGDSNFSIQIGIFLTLFTQCVLFFGGLLGQKDESKDYVKESLSRPHEVDTSKAHLHPEVPKDQMSLADYDK